MSDLELHEIDYEAAYSGYLDRFSKRFGERPEGAFVKFGKHMVQKLPRGEFPRRLDHYVQLHRAVKDMLETGSTISDALVLDFVEASAWIGIQAPDMYSMFRGELGDPKLAAPNLDTTVDHRISTQRTLPSSEDPLRSTARDLPSSRERSPMTSSSELRADLTEPEIHVGGSADE
ncbi:hypothetical protein [Sandaracinus amylolyticus]|uniref:Uncharacterized protein n=1 Tax=Sandaracinus amylolyticus TaxID=927083 RepID=A0A0F6W3W1_9BACT|nr:hypothetical protein [Sandaracinus amylolyticus]AKF06658.1 hypothetical protein DB32_003807 [Sandaracinus amylolyticus]